MMRMEDLVTLSLWKVFHHSQTAYLAQLFPNVKPSPQDNQPTLPNLATHPQVADSTHPCVVLPAQERLVRSEKWPLHLAQCALRLDQWLPHHHKDQSTKVP